MAGDGKLQPRRKIRAYQVGERPWGALHGAAHRRRWLPPSAAPAARSATHFRILNGVGGSTAWTRCRDGLQPDPGLSEHDIAQVLQFYPALEATMPELRVLQPAMLDIQPTEQKNLAIVPQGTRTYDIRTFGESDTVIVLFEDDGGTLRYVDGDDDSGTSLNAHLRVRLIKGKRYVTAGSAALGRFCRTDRSDDVVILRPTLRWGHAPSRPPSQTCWRT